LIYTQTINGEDRQATPCKTSNSKPPGLPVFRFDHEGDRGLRTIPKINTVGGNNAEKIGARAQVLIDNLPILNDVAPTLIGAIKLIAEQDAFRHTKVCGPVIQGNAPNPGGNLDGVLRIDLPSASEHGFNSNRDRNHIF
jgi:hypothetical protein